MKKHVKDTPKRQPEEQQPKPRTRIRLKTAKDVARYIARCIKKAEQGGEGTELYRRVCMATMLIKALEVADLEGRVKQLEEFAAKQG